VIENRLDGYELRLTGFSVSCCIVDFGFTLHLVRPLAPARNQRDQGEATLRIEGPFDYTTDGVTNRCDTERDPRTARQGRRSLCISMWSRRLSWTWTAICG